MTEPALVVLAHGSRDPRSPRAVREIASRTRELCSGPVVETAFLDHVEPDLGHTVDRLAGDGHRQIVVVPLFLTAAFHARIDCPAEVVKARARHAGISIRLAEVVGSEAALLTALDDRLSAALGTDSAGSPDALVLASAGTSDPSANETVAALARRWGQRHGLAAGAAFASTTGPSAAEAVRRLTAAGHRRVAVGSLFIAPGTLPDRVRACALQAGAVAVSDPLGAHPQLCQTIVDRYRVSASRFGVLV